MSTTAGWSPAVSSIATCSSMNVRFAATRRTRISGSCPSWAASSSSFWESWRTSSTSTGMYLPSSYFAALTSSSSVMMGMEMYRTKTNRPLTEVTTRLVLKAFLENISATTSATETWGETSPIANSVIL